MKIVKVLLLLAVASAFFGCTSQAKLVRKAKLSRKVFQLTTAEEILSQMTTEEKVAQLFVITPDALSVTAFNSITKKFINAEKKYPVGGFIFFGRHIEDSEQIYSYTYGLGEFCPIPPILAIEEEGGSISRLANSRSFYLPKFKDMETVGKTNSVENARIAGQIIGSYLNAYGFNLNLAPIADVNTNPENIIIGNHAFGSNPSNVSKMVGGFLSGMHATGVKGCLKHFPGHGDTKGSTDSYYVSVTKTWDEMKKSELVPFIENLQAADSIMVAHIMIPSVDDTYPASLSKKLITEKLRGDLGYQGVVMTDRLSLGVLEMDYGPGETSVLALEAGNDILFMPDNFFAAYDAVLFAVQEGRISMERLDESVLRILKLKDF